MKRFSRGLETLQAGRRSDRVTRRQGDRVIFLRRLVSISGVPLVGASCGGSLTPLTARGSAAARAALAAAVRAVSEGLWGR